MKTRPFILLLTTAIAAAFTLPAHAQKKPALNIYCWSEYIPQPVIDAFAKSEKVKVNVENYASNEEMLAKLQAGGAKYDLIQPSEYVIEELIKNGSLEELNIGNLPNFKNLDPKYLKQPHDPENKYSIPWMAGTVGIVVNTQKIKAPVAGYGDVFTDAHKKRIVILSDARESVSWALNTLGIPVNDINPDNLAKAKDVLAKWLPLVKVFDSDSPKTAFLNGSVDLGVVWSGEASILYKKNKKFAYVLPKEGAHLFIDNLAIPKGAKNKDLAEKFINYVLDPKVAYQVWQDFPYITVNAEARKLMTKDELAIPSSNPPADAKLEVFRALPKETSQAIDKLVTDLKNK
jgi:spermidine/putrescine transport system substrate-binding protein